MQIKANRNPRDSYGSVHCVCVCTPLRVIVGFLSFFFSGGSVVFRRDRNRGARARASSRLLKAAWFAALCSAVRQITVNFNHSALNRLCVWRHGLFYGVLRDTLSLLRPEVRCNHGLH